MKTDLYKNQAVTAGIAPSVLTACAGSTVQFASTSTGATNQSWTYSGGSLASNTGTNLGLYFPAPGTFSITLIVSNPTSSSSITQTVLIVSNNLASNFTTTNSACSNCNTGAISVNVNGGTQPLTYTWQPTGGNASTASLLATGCYTLTVNDANGCASKAVSCISFFTGLSMEENYGFRIYPNPAQSLLNIDCDGAPFDYAVHDQAGKLLISQKNNLNKTSVSLSEFPKGIYTIELHTKEKKLSQKIIIY